jgi:hypothetical protein
MSRKFSGDRRAGWKLPPRGDKDRIGETDGEYSVCQFFMNDTHEYVRRWVGPEEAMAAFKFYTQNVASRMGIVQRVIVTDGGDCTNAEWVYEKGITFPPEAKNSSSC